MIKSELSLKDKKVILTVGLPYSGKSTWAKRQGMPIVNRDAIRLSLHGKRYIDKMESLVTIFEENMVMSLLLSGHQEVIIDACHNTQERRDKWANYCTKNGIGITLKIFDTIADVCEARALKNDDKLIIPIIWKMYQKADFYALKLQETAEGK